MTLRLLGKAASINVRKVLWTCVELGIAFEREDWGSGFVDPNVPEFIALNPNAMVPVIVDGDFVLWESNAICRYLAGREQRHDLLPQTARERALVEQWMDWQAGEFNNSWRYAFMSLVRNSAAHQDPALLATGVAAWHKHAAILAARIEQTGAYAAGARFTLADVVLGLSVHRWLMAPLPHRPALPALDEYYARLGERAGFVQYGIDGGA